MIPITRPHLPPLEDYVRLLERIWESRMLSNFGEFATELEQLTSGRLGVGTRVVVSGDIGLMIAIAAFELPEGAAVVVPSFTFNSTVNAVIWNRLRPVFADIDPHTFNVDPADAERACRDSDARLIIGTHVFGAPCDVDALQDVASRCGTHLLFDAAHAYGASHNGRAIGSFGDAEVFSLSGTKPVTSAEGGLIASADEAYLRKIDYLRAYGFQDDYNSVVVGLNGKMSELHAALGVLTLGRVDDALSARSELVERYKKSLSGVELQQSGAGDRSTFKDLAVVFGDEGARTAAQTVLAQAHVQTKRYFKPCHRMDAFRQYADRPLTTTDDIHARLLCIPLFEDLGLHEADRIASLISAAAR